MQSIFVSRTTTFTALLIACLLAGRAEASDQAGARDGLEGVEDVVLSAQYFRELGIEAQREGHASRAHAYFRRAAHLADKLSQAAIAEQYWTGQGVDADRVLGYIWMDLAAERGTPALLGMRESYWQALSAAERARVPALGPALYAVYGDVAAQPRQAREQRREKYKIVGSRVGWDSNVDVCVGVRQDSYDGCVTSAPAEAVRRP
jgi:TPR repeat protein